MNENIKTLKDSAESTMNEAHKTVDNAQSKVSEMAEKATDKVRDVASDLSARASDAASSMRDSAVGRMDDARDALSETGDRLAETLRRAAEEPDTGSMQQRVLSAVATGVSSAAGTLRERSVSEIAADLRDLARKHPGVFAAGAAVAGFALARFLRASDRRQDDYHYQRSWSSASNKDEGRS